MIEINKLIVGQLKCNCYIVSDKNSDEAIIIDPGDDADFIVSKLNTIGKDPIKIISTHGHFDHNMAVYELQKAYNIPYLISKRDISLLKNMPKSAKLFSNIDVVKVPEPDGFLHDRQKIIFNDCFFKVIGVPGHSPGSIALYNPQEDIVFVGDLLFKDGAIGRYDLSYSNKKDLFKSIYKIIELPENTIIYSGHGENTTVAKERVFHK